MIKFNESNCFGCGACCDICPKKCIELSNNIHNNFYPYIDKNKCINCGLCEQVCIINKEFNKTTINDFFLFKHKNENVLKESSSGGISVALAELALQNNIKVFGVIYDNLEAKTVEITNTDDISKMQKSKYVKSNMVGTYRKVFNYLKNNETVLFFGLPCEVSSLKKYCKNNNNLITVSLFCGGNLSPIYFKQYISYIEKKYKCDVKDIDFRSKKRGSEILLTEIIDTNDKRIEIKAPDNFYIAVLGSQYVRPSCLGCNFDIEKIESDIVIGDIFNKRRENGISLVGFNDKAKKIFRNLFEHGAVIPLQNPEKYYAHRKHLWESTTSFANEFYNVCTNKGIKKASYECVINKFPFGRKIYFLMPNSLKDLYTKWKRK